MDLTDSYWKSIDDGCLQAVRELGDITYKWTGPDAHDDALQSACVDAAVADGANAILIAANSAEGVNASLAKAAEAGCKIVYVDSAATYDCVTALSTDNVAAGRTAGETMKAALQEQGITEGAIGIMGVTVNTASCVARETGFREAFEGTAFTLAETVYMQDDVANIKNAVADGLSQNYVGFFGTNEGTTVGVGEAAKEAGAKTVIVGFDTSDAVLALVSEGVIHATMQQNPSVMGHDGMTIAIRSLDHMMERYILTSALVSAAVLAMVGAFIFRYIGGLTKLLHNVRRVLLKVSEGDLSDNRLTEIKSKDEFGELASGTEKLRNKVGNLLNDIQAGMLQLTEAAEKLSGMLKQNVLAAREMNDSVGQIHGKANSQKTAAQNASSDVETTRSAIDQMLRQLDDVTLLSGNIAGLSQNSRKILDELSDSSKESREAVKEISRQVAVTNESVQQIKSVTDYITNIAEETNLLALNASIEAARAGAAGKGFAVVALEIQKLAEESNHSASKIGENIRSLVEKTDGIVKVMGSIENALQHQEENVDKTKRLFEEMNRDIIQITEKESDMQVNVSSMNRAKDNMSHMISDLSESAVDNANLSKNAAEVTEQMMREIENLENLTMDLSKLANRLDENLHAFLV